MDTPSKSQRGSGWSQGIAAFLVAAAMVILTFAQNDYVESRVCREVAQHDTPVNVSTVCPSAKWCGANDDVTRKSASWMQVLNLVNTLPGIVVLGIAGPVSDAFGRKVVLVGSCMAQVLGSLVLLATSYWNLPLYFVIIGTSISGLTGNYVVVLMALFASASDLTTGPTDRTRLVARVEGGLFLGCAFGAIVFGQIGKMFHTGCDHTLIFLVIAILYTLALVWVGCMRDTLPVSQRRDWPGWMHANPIAALRRLLKTSHLRYLAFIFVMQCVIFFGYGTVMQLYTTIVLGWPNDKFGNLSVVQMLSAGTGMVFVIPSLHRCLASLGATEYNQDRNLLLLALTTCVAQYTGYAICPEKWGDTFFGLAAMGLLASVQPPLLRALISKEAQPSELGLVFGSVATVEAVAQMVWPEITLQIWKDVKKTAPSTVYALGAGVTFCSLIFALAFLTPPSSTRSLSLMAEKCSDSTKEKRLSSIVNETDADERDPLLQQSN